MNYLKDKHLIPKILPSNIVLIGLLVLSLSFSVAQAKTQSSYIIVHAVNPEGIEIASIEGMNPYCVEIYDGETLIGYGISNEEGCNTPIPISPGTHTIRVKFNGRTKSKNINIEEGGGKELVFTFERTSFDLNNHIYNCDLESRLSGSWSNPTEDYHDTLHHPTTEWYTDVRFCEPCGSGDPPRYGTYDGTAKLHFSFSGINYTWHNYAYYSIGMSGGEDCPPNTPYWHSFTNVDSGDYGIPSRNNNFEEWFVQYTVSGKVKFYLNDFLLEGSNKLLKIGANSDSFMRVVIGESFFTWGGSPSTKEDSGNGTFDVKMSSVPYDLTGTGIRCPPTVSFLDKEDRSRKVIGAAADGVSEVIIQISGLGDNISVNDIEITIPDSDGHLEDDEEIIDGVFTRTYVAPTNFVREGHSEDLKQGKRDIHFSITVNGQEVEHPQFFLIKPPIVLLHGLWSYACAWDNLKSRLEADHGYQYVVAYQYPNSVSFDQLKSVIHNAVYLALGLAKIDNYVAKKADVIAHSMGGVITKLYGHESNIKSITTVGTPHFGSPLADILWSLVDDDQNPFERFIARCFERSGHPATNGAIEDLRTTLHVEANRINVPTYVISGYSPLATQTTIKYVKLLAYVFKFSRLLSWTATLLDLNQFIFGGERNDWVVSESSQEGGCVGDDDPVWWHCAETHDKEILDKIINFLHWTPSTESMTQPTSIESEEMPKLKYALPPVEMGISSGFVEITHPTEGQVFQPGDTVNVKVNTSNETAMVLIATSTGESTLINRAPYNFQFVIPDEVIGPLSIMVGATDDTGFIGSDEVTINVASSSNLIDMKVYPEMDPLYLSVGATVPLTVYGLYDDGITREITSSGGGTSYSSSNSDMVEVSSEGLITVKSRGEAIVTIENSGVRKEITVIGRFSRGRKAMPWLILLLGD